MSDKPTIRNTEKRQPSKRREVGVPPRHQPSKAELEEPVHLPGQSPEDVARIVMQGGAQRREPTTDPEEPE